MTARDFSRAGVRSSGGNPMEGRRTGLREALQELAEPSRRGERFHPADRPAAQHEQQVPECEDERRRRKEEAERAGRKKDGLLALVGRIALREAMGYGAPHYPLADHYLNDRWMYGDAHRKLVKSGDWREHVDLSSHRYIAEDTELGLAFLASVARWAGAVAPIAHGLLAVAGGWQGRDLRNGARTLEALGLDNLDKAQMQRLLHDGE
jgi:hypothetical protein